MRKTTRRLASAIATALAATALAAATLFAEPVIAAAFADAPAAGSTADAAQATDARADASAEAPADIDELWAEYLRTDDASVLPFNPFGDAPAWAEGGADPMRASAPAFSQHTSPDGPADPLEGMENPFKENLAVALRSPRAYSSPSVYALNYNIGNPFENGDLTWDPNTQSYKLAGMTLRVTLTAELSGSPPFSYPPNLTDAYYMFVNDPSTGGNFPGWGISDYRYELTSETNSRGLTYTGLSSTGRTHCCQGNNYTVRDYANPRPARLCLLENESYWSDDGQYYTATFFLLVNNGGAYGDWDQASIGKQKVYATWRLHEPRGWFEVWKGSTRDKAVTVDAHYSLAKAKFGVYSDAACTNLVQTLTTTSNFANATHEPSRHEDPQAWSLAETAWLDPGTYYVKEIQAPKGYSLSTGVKSITVRDDEDRSGYLSFFNEPETYVKAWKTSAEAWTNNNGAYALGGATFGVYTDAACTNKVDEMVTKDPRGAYRPADQAYDYRERAIAESKWLPAGTYWVKEIKAPAGFNASSEAKRIDARADRDNAATFSDQVQYFEPQAVLQKIDQPTGKPQAAGDATLEGGEFRISYYDVSPALFAGFDAATIAQVESRHLAASWVFATDAGGRIDAGKPVSGSPLYLHGSKAYWPIGCYVVEETKAPAGYVRATGKKLIKVAANGMQTAGAKATAQFGSASAALRLDFADAPITGGVSVLKTDAETGRPVPQGQASLAGIKFEIKNVSKHPVTVEGTECPVGAVVKTIATDASGVAATPANCLPYGTYEISESASNDTYRPTDATTRTVSIRTPGVVVDACSPNAAAVAAAAAETEAASAAPASEGGKAGSTPRAGGAGPFKDEVVRGGVALEKRDFDTRRSEPQGNAVLEGTVFTITNRSAQSVVVEGVEYAPGQVVATMTTDEAGAAATAENLLPCGAYEIREVEAPAGYRLTDGAPRSFSIAEDLAIVKPFADDDAFFNKVERGGVEVRKADAQTKRREPQGDASLAGIEFTITNKSTHSVVVDGTEFSVDEDVKTIETDASGTATTGDESLPIGTYEIRESATNGSYRLTDGKALTFSITADDQIAAPCDAGGDYRNQVVRGGVAVQKRDFDTRHNAPQGDATLAGTVFRITNRSARSVVVDGVEYAPGRVVATIATDKDGNASTGAQTLPFGTYDIQETAASSGYHLTDGAARTFTIREDKKIVTPFSGSSSFFNKVWRGGVELWKVDVESDDNLPQGDAWLSGIVFDIKNVSAAPVFVEGRLCQPGEVVKQITTNKDGYAKTAADCLPFGTYEVYESATNDTYNLTDTSVRTVEVRQDGVVYQPFHKDGTVDGERYKNMVVRGDVLVHKRDNESYLLTPLGGAKLEKTAFEITNRSENRVIVGGVPYEPGEVCATIYAGADGIAKTEGKALPYGTYDIAEVAPGEGYLMLDGAQRRFRIRTEGEVDATWSDETYDQAASDNTKSWRNQVMRGDLQLVKVGAPDMRRLAGVPFALISQTTGERHILVTDANGEASTHAEWAAHSFETNANDDTKTGYRSHRGTWFGLTSEGWSVPVIDDAGALPYDWYTLEELPCEATVGYDLITVKNIHIYRDKHYINLGTLEDAENGDGTPEIGTQAADAADGNKVMHADATGGIIDTVSHTSLVPGREYALVGTLMKKGDDGAAVPVFDGEEASKGTSSARFTPASKNGLVNVAFTFDSTVIAKAQTTVFEELYLASDVDAEGNPKPGAKPLAEHKDIEDGAQTVRVDAPRIGTKATDAADGDKKIAADAQAEVLDTVSYRGLVPGKTYAMAGTLMCKSTGEPVRDESGLAATAKTEFVAEDESGEVDLLFAFDASKLAGEEIVAFEALSQDGIELAAHADINDKAQTVVVTGVAIETTARDGADEDKLVAAGPAATVVDTVSYKGLVPDKEYRLEATLAVKSSGKPVEDAAGKAIRASKDFTPDESKGSVDVEIPFDATELASDSVVVFETLLRDGAEVAAHAELDNESQTVVVANAEVGTSATDAADGDKTVSAGPGASIVDQVSYAGLVPGAEYVVRGQVVVKSTGKPLLDAEGSPVAAGRSFTPQLPSGEMELAFDFDATELAGERLVVFETMLQDGVEVAAHADLDDAEQTVEVEEPSIATTAVDALDGDKTVSPGANALVTDTVAYAGLVPGTQYALTGTLVLKSTGEPLVNDEGNPVRATKTFKPVFPEGEVQLDLGFDATALGGQEVVAFESLAKDGVEVATHADLDDAGQTVEVAALKIKTTAADGADGDKLVAADPEAVVVDTVAYDGLVPDKEYTISGLLVHQSTGEPLIGADGKPVGATKTFRPHVPSGTERIEFHFDASMLGEAALVACEKLLLTEKVIASHEDLEDEGQTVTVASPRIATSAKDAADGDKQAAADSKAKIIDTLSYEGLVPGKEYTASGLLMDKETGKPYADAAGNAVTADVAFIPAKAAGSVEVAFEFDCSGQNDRQIVVFEKLLREGATVVAHEDLDDQAQTVTVMAPAIFTNAKDASDNDQFLARSEWVRVVDEVSYENVVPGREYVLAGTLVDKETGRPVVSNGIEVAARKSFVPNQPSGTVDVEMALSTAGLDGHDLVAFEALSLDGRIVAAHADVNDEAQTVSVQDVLGETGVPEPGRPGKGPDAPAGPGAGAPEPAQATPYDKTGAAALATAMLTMLLATSAALSCRDGIRRLLDRTR